MKTTRTAKKMKNNGFGCWYVGLLVIDKNILIYTYIQKRLIYKYIQKRLNVGLLGCWCVGLLVIDKNILIYT